MSDASERHGDDALTAERWRTIEPILDGALELPAAQRPAFVRDACAGDAALAAAVERLLSTHDTQDADLDQPAAQRFASLLDDPLDLPEILGDRYRIGRVLGRGGMATVFLADDIPHDRKVAVKVMRPELAASLGVERFLSEIRTTAQLQHPHILPLHDSGKADGLLFYVMAYAAEGSLRGRLQRERQLPIDTAVRIATEIAGALEAAHRHGVVHRDIKPENILLQGDSALVADFGIALAVHASAPPRITGSGVTPGTPQYMSPEQLKGADTIDGRSDIFSLGAVLYEMLAGEPPFTGDTAQEIIQRRLAGPPPALRSRRAGIPRLLETAVERALATDPAQRYRTAGEFAEALAGALTGSSGVVVIAHEKPNGAWRRRTRVAWAALALGAAATTLALSLIVRNRGAEPPRRPTSSRLIAVLPFEVHSSDSSLTFLRDGMPDLIAAALAGTPQLLVADQHEVSSALRERAVAAGVTQPRIAAALLRRLGAARVVTGSVVGASRRLIINLRSFDSTGSGDFPVEVAGSIDSIAGLVDRLASALLAGTVARDEAHLSDLAGRSLPALRSYVRGRSLYRQGRLDSAVAAFREALHTDSTFALAALGIAAAGGWTVTSLSLRETRDFRIGWKLRLGLSSNDRALFDAYVGPRDPSEQTDLGQLAAWERVYVLVPERAEVAYEYGDRLFHVGEYLGVVRPQQQAAQAFAYAVSRDSGLVSPLAHLVEITARGEDKERARALLRVYETGDTTADAAAYLRWQIAVRTGDSVALRALRGRIPDFSSYSLRRLISLSQIDAMGVGDAERAMTALLIRQATPGDRGIILHRAHAFALNRGRVAESEMYLRELRSLGTSDASWAVRYGDAVQHQVFDALFSVGDSTTARNAASELLPSADANRSRHRFPFTTSADACTLELWRLSRGVSRHSAETLARLRRAEAQSDSAHYYGWNPRVCIAMIEAAEAVVVSRPNAEGFLARLDSIMMTGPHQFGASVGNLLLARLYASRGDREKALRALRRRWRDVDDGPLYVADGFALEFRLLEEAGDTSASAAVRERYRALRGGDAVNVPLWPSLAKR